MDNETLNEIRIEDYIWIIYIFLAIFAIVSNYFEKEYLKKHDKKDENTFRTINTEIFIVTFLIYLYFVYINYKHIKRLDENSSPLVSLVTMKTTFYSTSFKLRYKECFSSVLPFNSASSETLTTWYPAA
mgnify:CR=1 FL=1